MDPDLLQLGSLELPDFDGAFWFDKLDDLGVGEIPGQPINSSGPVVALPASIDQIEGNPPQERILEADIDSDPNSDELLRDASPPPPQRRRRGRGRAKSNLSVEDRRLKNREIQARYRARQRDQQAELETTCIQVSRELDDARRESIAAHQANEIMEKVLFMRETAVGILAKGSSSGNLPSSISKESQEGDEHSVKMIDNPNCVIQGVKSSEYTVGSSEMTSDSGGSGSGVNYKYKTLSTDKGAPVHSIAEAYDAAKRLDEGEPEEIARDNPEYQELVSNVRNMTGHQLVESWRYFALQLRKIIDAHEKELSEGGTGARRSVLEDKESLARVMEQLEPLFEEHVSILSTALRHNLPAVQALFDTATGDVGPDPTEYWNTVAEKMEITPRQREMFVSLWKAYGYRIESLKQQRNNMVKSLIQAAGLSQQDDLGGGGGGGSGGSSSGVNSGGGIVRGGGGNIPSSLPVDSLHHMMERYCTLFDATGNVAATPDNELTALLDLMREAGLVWSLYQKAKLTALAYPAFPDIVHFLKAVATKQEANNRNGTSLMS